MGCYVTPPMVPPPVSGKTKTSFALPPPIVIVSSLWGGVKYLHFRSTKDYNDYIATRQPIVRMEYWEPPKQTNNIFKRFWYWCTH